MSEDTQARLLNIEMLDAIRDADDGTIVKSASATATKATRTQIREEGFQRAIIPFDTVTDSELDYFGDDELPGLWFELEPDSPPARTITYNSSPHTFFYRAEKYIVLISVITTEEATKNINQLRRYKTDLRQIVSDNMLRDIHTEEDVSFITQVDRIVGSQVNLSAQPDKEVQNINFNGAMTRETLKRAQSFLSDRKLPTGVYLVNQRTANELLGFERNEVGGDLAETLFRKGLAGLEKFEVFGNPYIATIKNELVLNGIMYQFAPKEWLGNALMLEDITVTIEKKRDIIRMFAQEQVGLTIGAPRGVQKLQFSIGY